MAVWDAAARALLGLLLLGSSLTLVGSDIPRCHRDNPDFTISPYCLPYDYNKDIVPPTDGPLFINVNIFVFEVSKIDDIALSMTFELYFDLTWKETRLVINESSPEWGPDGVMGSTNFVKSMWLPDIQILNLKQFQKRNIVTDVAGLIIFQDLSVLYTVSTEAIISCPMKFSAYPLDYQECKFNVGSYIHDATQIFFTGTYNHDEENQRAQQYEIKITDLDEEDMTIVWANRNYSQTGFKINLIRRRTPVLLQVYLPSGLFVVVSWISFIVPPEVVPGRMALLVTLFLVLVNIFNSVTANAPKAEGLTAVETWVVMCILHVFCVLCEYAMILKIIQIEKRKMSRSRRVVAKTLETSGSAHPNGGNGHHSEVHVGVTDRGIPLGQIQQRVLAEGSNLSTSLEQVFEADPDFPSGSCKGQYGSTPCVPASGAGTQSSSGGQQQLQQQQFHHHHQHFVFGSQGEILGSGASVTGIGNHVGLNNRTSCLRHRNHLEQPDQDDLCRDCPGSGGGSASGSGGEMAAEAETTWNRLNILPQTRPIMTSSAGMSQHRITEKYDRIDRIAMWLFPVVFFLFNVLYWSYYLMLNEVVQELW